MKWLCLGIVTALTALFVMAADAPPTDASRIDKLIEQLGSDSFEDRESATKALDALGEVALDKLEAATKSTDAEVRKRAMGLVARIGPRALSKRMLRPTEVRLVFKNTPMTEAVAEVSKTIGLPIQLHDPENKLKDRKITLDTGKVSLWEALAKFQAEAGLTEVDRSAMGADGPLPPGAARDEAEKRLKEAMERVRKARSGVAAPAPAPVPVPVPAPAPAPDDGAAPFALRPIEVVPPAPPAGAPPAVAAPGIAILPALPPMGGPMPAPGMPWALPTTPTNILVLGPGKDTLAADTRSSVRVRVAPESMQNLYGPPAAGQKRVVLQAAPEPRMRWQQLVSVNIDTALDDNDQKLSHLPSAAPVPPPGGGFGFGGAGGGIAIARPAIAFIPAMSQDGINQSLPIQFNKSDKESKSLKRLEGSITARLLAEAKPLIEVKDVMKAAGKLIKGDKGGTIEVKAVNKAADGTIQIAFEFTAPENVVADGDANNPGFDMPGAPMPGIAVPLPAVRPIRIRPALPPKRAVPMPLPPKPVDGPAPMAMPVEKPAVKIEIGGVAGGVVVGGGGVVIGGPAGVVIGGGMPGFAGYAGTTNGLSLRDDKNNPLPMNMSISISVAGGVVKNNYVAVYRPGKGMPAEPTSLVFMGRSSIEVTIPFKLENVPLK